MVNACFHLNDFLLMPLAIYTMNKYLYSVGELGNGCLEKSSLVCYLEIHLLLNSVCRADIYFQFIQILLKPAVAWKNQQGNPVIFTGGTHQR